MHVVTRSKSKLNQNLHISVDENSKRTVSVLLSTPERITNAKYNCPPAPRAPTPIKQKLSDNAKNVAKRLDFSNMEKKIETEKYPMNYRGFLISDNTKKNKVDQFLDMINTYATEKYDTMDNEKEESNTDILNDLSSQELFEIAKSLMKNTKLHKTYEDIYNSKKPMHTIVKNWAQLLCSAIRLGLSRELSKYHSNKCSKLEQSYMIINGIIPYVVHFRDVFMSNAYSQFGLNHRFLSAIINQMLYFTSEGIVYGAFVIGHYYPEMVSKECRPYMDTFNKLHIHHNCELFDKSPKDEIICKLYCKYMAHYVPTTKPIFI